MDDHRVILEVQRHRILYDTADLFYKDNMRKEQAWSEVAAALGADPADCKARWRILRDSFVKHVKKVSVPNGPPGVAPRDWKYTTSMSFILPFIQARRPKRRLVPLSDPDRDRPAPPSSLNPSPCPALPAAPSPLWAAPLEEDKPSMTDGDRDEMYHFAMSTVPLLLRLGKRQRRKAKMEILQTLDRLEEEEEQLAAVRRYLHPAVSESIAGDPQRPVHDELLLLRAQDHPLLQELREDEGRFREFFTLSTVQFNELLQRVASRITLQDTNYRRPIPAAVRLGICLRYLASGEQLKMVAENFGVALSSVCKIMPQVTTALWDCLQPEVMPDPSIDDWSAAAEEFEQRWDFPLCCGALSGRCVELKPHPRSGPQYDGSEASLVLVAVVDARGRFRVVEVGGYRRASDGAALIGSEFYRALREDRVRLPPDAVLPGAEHRGPLPHVFAADEAFPLRRNVMRSFPGNTLSQVKQVFNRRLSRARQPARDAFNLLTSQWGLYSRPAELRPEVVEQCVRVSCLLHNFIMTSAGPECEQRGSAELERAPEGALEGTSEGTSEGAPEGTSEGAPEGTLEGAPEGNSEGAPEGTPEGASEGTVSGGDVTDEQGCGAGQDPGLGAAEGDQPRQGMGYIRGSALHELERTGGQKPTRQAMWVREVFAAFFSAEGAMQD